MHLCTATNTWEEQSIAAATPITGPTSGLKIIGGTSTTADLWLQSTSGVGATGADIHFLVGNNGGTEAGTILNNGNWGIGTTEPSQLLHLNVTTGNDGLLIQSLDTTNPRISLKRNSTYGWQLDASSNTATVKALGGSGYSFLNNTDSSIMRILDNGNVGIGTTNPPTKFSVVDTSSSEPRGISSYQYSTDTNGAREGLFKARGTPAVPTTVVTGDMLGRINGWGYDGTSWLNMASIQMSSTGTIETNRIPTAMSFWTATDASPSVLTQRMTIDAAGTITASGNVGASGFTAYSAAGEFALGPTGNSAKFGIYAGNTYLDYLGALIFRAGFNGPGKARMASDGSFGLGTTFATGAPAKLSTVAGTTLAYDSSSLGPEKVNTGDMSGAGTWSVGANWAIAGGVAQHTAGDTATLSQDTTEAANATYKVVFTVSGRTAGSVALTIGGVAGTTISSNTTSTQYIFATGTGNLTFTPSSDFDGAIDDVSVKLVSSFGFHDGTNYANGVAGVTASGTSCTVTAITNGIITGASCI